MPGQAWVVSAVVAVALLAFWLGCLYWTWKMIRGRKEGVRAFGPEVWYNPFYLCFRPSLLTEKGLRARKWLTICYSGLALCMFAVLLLFWWLDSR